jgi:hypothetical protein
MIPRSPWLVCPLTWECCILPSLVPYCLAVLLFFHLCVSSCAKWLCDAALGLSFLTLIRLLVWEKVRSIIDIPCSRDQKYTFV